MADFRTHVTFSSMLGCGYSAAGYAAGVPWDTALVGGGLCGLSGMLPDLDSDSGIPLRESMAFAAAIVPVLLLDRLRALNFTYDQTVLTCAGLYFFVRFGVTKMIARRTKHRGMFHSIPAALIFAGGAFLLCGCTDLSMRYYKAGGVFLGVMSHLVLDEYYSFQVKGGRLRIKNSFGTALKFWSKDSYSNFSTYAKLFVIAGLIFSDGTVMAHFGARSPSIADTFRNITDGYFAASPTAPSVTPPAPETYPTPAPPIGHVEPSQPAPFQPGVNFFEANQQNAPQVSYPPGQRR